jgi:hypothetical protein
MKRVDIPPLTGGQRESWRGLLEIASALPKGWTLIGGQLVQLHCWEKGVTPLRVTTDADAVLDVVTVPDILLKFTSCLKENGFEALNSSDGLQYRWIRGGAQIDVLLMEKIGARARARTGVNGAPSMETPGSRTALDYSEPIEIVLEGQRAVINRPNLIGALYIKSRASHNSLDVGQDRHLIDFATLAALFSSSDIPEFMKEKVKAQIQSGIARVQSRSDILAFVDGSFEGLERLKLALG